MISRILCRNPSAMGVVRGCLQAPSSCHPPRGTFQLTVVWRVGQCSFLTDFFFFSPLFFRPQKPRVLGLFYWAVSRHWTKRGHFCPGGSGIARELAKSKPELIKEGLGWVRGGGSRASARSWLQRGSFPHGFVPGISGTTVSRQLVGCMSKTCAFHSSQNKMFSVKKMCSL